MEGIIANKRIGDSFIQKHTTIILFRRMQRKDKNNYEVNTVLKFIPTFTALMREKNICRNERSGVYQKDYS